MRQGNPPGLFYGYKVVLAAALIMVVTWGTVYSFGVFFKPIISDLGWSRAALSSAYSFAFVVNGFLGIFAGRLCDKIGPRMATIAGGCLIALAYFLMSRVDALWQMYLFYVVIIGTGLSGIYVPAISTVARWFNKRRGLMTGVVIAGISVGTLITSPVATWLIGLYGWRHTYIVMGIAVLVVVTLGAFFLKRDPREMGLKAYGEDSNGPKLQLQTGGFSFSAAVRTPVFWMLCIMLPSFEFCADTVMVHIVPHVTDVGISAIAAAGILATIGALSLVGRVGVGAIGDRIGNRRIFTICMGTAVVAFVWLLFVRQIWAFTAFAVIFGFAYGGYGPLISLLTADLFGLRSLGVILGMVTFFVTVGAAVGPIFAGWVFDTTGSYQLAFAVCAFLALAALLVSLFLKRMMRASSENS